MAGIVLNDDDSFNGHQLHWTDCTKTRHRDPEQAIKLLPAFPPLAPEARETLQTWQMMVSTNGLLLLLSGRCGKGSHAVVQ